jgi:hypothetical protein
MWRATFDAVCGAGGYVAFSAGGGYQGHETISERHITKLVERPYPSGIPTPCSNRYSAIPGAG